jgi:Predicted membrane protein
MATLTAWKFDTPDGAEQAVDTLESLAKQQLIKVHDAATVTWEPDKKKPKTRQLSNLVGVGALGGAFWGLLFGLIFFVPLLGLAIGAGMGALAGSLGDVGIDDDFVRRARDEITPGTSALFVMTSEAVEERVRQAFAGQKAQLMFTNLSSDQEAALRTVFSE